MIFLNFLISSITYPAISAFVSMHADADKQGLVQGMITGMRGLCNGLGPAMFGLIFSLFHVDLTEKGHDEAGIMAPPINLTQQQIDVRFYLLFLRYIPAGYSNLSEWKAPISPN